jgi:hypothetical protein
VVLTEINEWFIEDQAFLPSYNLAPLPLLPVRKLYRRHAGRLRKTKKLLTGEGVGEKPNHTRARKPWSSINHSKLVA